MLKEASKAAIEAFWEGEVEIILEEEFYESWLKHNEVDGGDNTDVLPKYQQENDAEKRRPWNKQRVEFKTKNELLL